MKVYLSVPMIANRAVARAAMMAKVIEESGHEISSPWVLGPLDRGLSSGVDVFERDLKGVESSDIIVADLTDPSNGVGMEIMAAYKAKKRIILVQKRGRIVSRMIEHMGGKETVEYESEEELSEGLRRLL